MDFYIELAPKKLTGKARTHKVTVRDITEAKNYAMGQLITGWKRPAWAIVKSNSDPSTENNSLYFVGCDFRDGKFEPFEHIYSKDFQQNHGQNQKKPVSTIKN